MKKLAISICVVLALGGCRTIDDRFADAKRYTASTKPIEWDVSAFFRLIKPIYEGRDSVPFLLNKTKREDPTDRILACMLLNELIDQVSRQPTPQGLAFIRGVNPAELLAQLEGVPTNALAENWLRWYAVEHERAEKHLEPGHCGDGARRAR